MNFQIYKEKVIFIKPNELNKDNMVEVEKGKIDFSNLSKSNFHTVLKDIPEENQKELNEKGKTLYEVVERYFVEILN